MISASCVGSAASLRRVLAALRHRLTALLAGLGVTAWRSDSTATALMVGPSHRRGDRPGPGPATCGSRAYRHDLATWALAFDITLMFPLLLPAGLIGEVATSTSRTRPRNFGRAHRPRSRAAGAASALETVAPRRRGAAALGRSPRQRSRASPAIGLATASAAARPGHRIRTCSARRCGRSSGDDRPGERLGAVPTALGESVAQATWSELSVATWGQPAGGRLATPSTGSGRSDPSGARAAHDPRSRSLDARTDVFFRPARGRRRLVVSALGRASAYEQGGADGLFVPGLQDERLIGRWSRAPRYP